MSNQKLGNSRHVGRSYNEWGFALPNFRLTLKFCRVTPLAFRALLVRSASPGRRPVVGVRITLLQPLFVKMPLARGRREKPTQTYIGYVEEVF